MFDFRKTVRRGQVEVALVTVFLLCFMSGVVSTVVVQAEKRQHEVEQRLKRDQGPFYVYTLKRELLFIADQYHAGHHTVRVGGHEMKLPEKVIISKERLEPDPVTVPLLEPKPERVPFVEPTK